MKRTGMIVDRFKKYDILIPDSYALYDYHVTFKGIAKCAPEDTFDENYGKRLAEYRARRMMCRVRLFLPNAHARRGYTA